MTIRTYIQINKFQRLEREPSKVTPMFYPKELMENIPISNTIELYVNADRSRWVCLDLSDDHFVLLEDLSRKVRGRMSDDCRSLGKR